MAAETVVRHVYVMRKEKSIPAAFLLWILFGGFGAHRFYVRRYLTGLVMLIVFPMSLVMFISAKAIPEFRYPWIWMMPIVLWVSSDVFKIARWVKQNNSGERLD